MGINQAEKLSLHDQHTASGAQECPSYSHCGNLPCNEYSCCKASYVCVSIIKREGSTERIDYRPELHTIQKRPWTDILPSRHRASLANKRVITRVKRETEIDISLGGKRNG